VAQRAIKKQIKKTNKCGSVTEPHLYYLIVKVIFYKGNFAIFIILYRIIAKRVVYDLFLLIYL